MKISLHQYKNLLVTYSKPQWQKILLLFVLLLASNILQLIYPQLIGHFIDEATLNIGTSRLGYIAWSFLGIVFFGQIINSLAAYFTEDVAWTATNNLRQDVSLHCVKLDLGFHQVHTPGEMITRIDEDISVLANFFSQFILRIIGTTILLAGSLVLLYYTKWQMGLIFSIYSIITLFILSYAKRISVPYFKSLRESAAQIAGSIGEWIIGLEDIAANGSKDFIINKFYLLMRNLAQRAMKSTLIGSTLSAATLLLFAIANALVLGGGAYFYDHKEISLGAIFIIFTYSNVILGNLQIISSQLDDFQRATASIQRISEIYYTKSRIADTGTTSLAPGSLEITFDDVSFAYNPGTLVLDNIRFQLKSGKTLGLLGRTGSGKTTIAKLLFRFYEPTNGTIYMNNIDIRQIPLGDMRKRIAMVTQDVQLFNGTLRDNIALFDNNIPDKQILEAIKELGLWSWYEGLPKKLDTEITSGGNNLSAGQAQLLAFTRVFLKDPDLIILDEASARLDPATENLIETAIRKLLENRTAIIIAHHLGTIQRSDEIMIVEGGHIVEYGIREELTANEESVFSGLMQTGLREVLV